MIGRRLRGNAYCIHDGGSRVSELSAKTASSFFLRCSKEGHAGSFFRVLAHTMLVLPGIYLTLSGNKTTGATTLVLAQGTNVFQYFWIAIYIGTYGYLRGSSALVLSCFLYYSLQTSARPSTVPRT